MTVDTQQLKLMIENELARLTDSRVIAHIRSLLVEPTVAEREWDYGREGERHPCWTVLRHRAFDMDIVYCEHGFGPQRPWGHVFMERSGRRTSMGMDSGWFPTFLETYFDSFAVTELPIWRVFKCNRATGERQAISDEGEWNATWGRVMALRESDPANRYDCDTSVQYEHE